MAAKTRIFIDAHTFDNEFQGSRTFIKYLYKSFIHHTEFDFYFAAHDIENLKDNFGEFPNVHYIKLKSKNSISRLLFELPFILKKYKIDYAHFQYVVPPIKVCKYIVTTHDVIFLDFPEEFSWNYKKSKSFMFNFSAKKADILTTVSGFSRQSIHKWFNIDLNKIHIIPNAVQDKFFKDHDKASSKKYILEKYGIENYGLVVSRIEPRKNQIAVLKAFSDLGLFKKGYRLVFIGTKSINDPKLEQQIDSLSPEEKKMFYQLEGISEYDLIEFYNAAELSVYPSKCEGFGIPPLESGALKTPTLCSNISAMADFTLFGDGLFNPSDQLELEKKIENSLNVVDEERLEEIKNEILHNYSWDNSANLFYNLFK